MPPASVVNRRNANNAADAKRLINKDNLTDNGRMKKSKKKQGDLAL